MKKERIEKIIALIIVLLIIQLEGLLAAPVHPADSSAVTTVNGKAFIQYKVQEHDGWYSIAREAGVEYSDLRNANKDVGDKLSVGQVILIPSVKKKIVNPASIYKNKHPETVKEEKGEPVYYSVKQKETLFAIAKKYKIKKEEIKKWNNLDSENLKKGQQLIVGYKKVKEKPVTASKEEKTGVKTEKHEALVAEKAEIKNNPVRIDTVVSMKETGETKITADSQNVNKSFIGKDRKLVTEQGVATWIEDESINPNKYFALHRTASNGSIVKVTNRMNKRTVFVKVVGKLPDTGDNENVIIKISKLLLKSSVCVISVFNATCRMV